MKLFKHQIIFLLSVVILFNGCNIDNCFQRPGEDVSEEFNIGMFSHVEINDVFDVQFFQSDDYKVIIEGGKNLINKIDINLSDSTLSVSDNNICNWSRSYEERLILKIYCDSLKSFTLNGECDVSFENEIYGDSIQINIWTGISNCSFKLDYNYVYLGIHSAYGDYSVSGKSGHASLYSNGSAYLHALEFKVNSLNINSKTTGDCFINVSDLLVAQIHSSGKVYYHGNPVVREYPDVSGKLIQLDSTIIKSKLSY